MKTTIVVALYLVVVAVASYCKTAHAATNGPSSPEAEMKSQEQFCQSVGDIFASAAVLRDSPITLDQALAKAGGTVQKDAVIFAYGHKHVIPYAAAWFGYGFCMARAGAENDEAL